MHGGVSGLHLARWPRAWLARELFPGLAVAQNETIVVGVFSPILSIPVSRPFHGDADGSTCDKVFGIIGSGVQVVFGAGAAYGTPSSPRHLAPYAQADLVANVDPTSPAPARTIISPSPFLLHPARRRQPLSPLELHFRRGPGRLLIPLPHAHQWFPSRRNGSIQYRRHAHVALSLVPATPGWESDLAYGPSSPWSRNSQSWPPFAALWSRQVPFADVHGRYTFPQGLTLDGERTSPSTNIVDALRQSPASHKLDRARVCVAARMPPSSPNSRALYGQLSPASASAHTASLVAQ
ncbi:hypothetical protein DFH08DRAFT_1086332 [Mycena albidolilacea]|uniref:Uncharacterized protein n=1 Tax=Mycena albidolilacea TaxID=1033008 RepID=A0AAD6ZE22_9AGAR|nr:hypothetical protein DFH08DRAFT_1086332 [Mycena albidolilacea]